VWSLFRHKKPVEPDPIPLFSLVTIVGDVRPNLILLHEGDSVFFGRTDVAPIHIAGDSMNVAKRQLDVEVVNGEVLVRDNGYYAGERFGRSVTVNGQRISFDPEFLTQFESDLKTIPYDELRRTKLIDKAPIGPQPTWYKLQPGDIIRIGPAELQLEAVG
jgi:hypothetical protein